MKLRQIITTAMLSTLVGLGASQLLAKDKAAAPKKVVNKTCPVGGDAVDPDADTFEWKGKTYGTCCSGCVDKFKANPAKYEKNLKEDAGK